MTKIDNNYNNCNQDQTVHLDNQAQLYALKVKDRPGTSMTKTNEDCQRRLNIKTRSDRHQIHLKVKDNNKVNKRMDPYQAKVTSVWKQDNKPSTSTLEIKTNSTNVRQRDIVKRNISGQLTQRHLNFAQNM